MTNVHPKSQGEVMSVLHVICGNCGSKDVYYERGEVDEDSGDQSVIGCNDCATLHFLSEMKSPHHSEE